MKNAPFVLLIFHLNKFENDFINCQIIDFSAGSFVKF